MRYDNECDSFRPRSKMEKNANGMEWKSLSEYIKEKEKLMLK